ncbi:Glycosyl transferase family 2 [Pseudodesulfovibrio profundus]|uniref:Glycosyl transferase family 2 n=1 Tax=Pseudodesulfovibrio profundus TaxID=57320 RepID=A0A2C8FDE4_9BACT|nr:glycosyltransferase [Pseudodesulfovibrio profundus]SOB59912.1 Glycosyl transferase family 2 [Pseudodesulfovibrio profundus]
MNDSFDFAAMPEDIRRHLLLGFSGRPHLHGAVEVVLNHSRRPDDLYARMAADMLLAAWGENPLDGNCVAALAGRMDKLPAVSKRLLPAIKSVLAHWQPEVTPEAQVAMQGSGSQQLTFLRDQLRHQLRNLFWWHHLYEYARIHGDWPAFREQMSEAQAPEGLARVFSCALGHALFAKGDRKAASVLYGDLLAKLPLPIIDERLAMAWLGRGKIDEGLLLLQQCAASRPWNVSLQLRQYELAVDGANALAAPAGQTMVLAYSWNKADDLAATLDSLVRSDLESVQVRVLDNGSTDRTPEVIRQFIDKFGSDKASVVTMPVNVGAPAARNWLMHLPEVRESEHVAFIDDDIELPGDWLKRLGAVASRYPEAGVWGCKVVDYHGPSRMQCGEHNLYPVPGMRRETLMSTLMLQDSDFGQMDYMRPCASVTGCVHLFRTSRLLQNGDFDLRFSPTQYDDLDRDLRMVLSGGYAAYTGFLAIPHKRRSGSLSETGKPEAGGATANMHKLLAKYSDGEFEAMAKVMDAVLLDDVQKKIKALGESGTKL